MRDWKNAMQLPDTQEITLCNRRSKARSPYICGWMRTGSPGFTKYAIDIKADYLPCGTYCCAVNFDLDYSALEKKYKIRTEYKGVAGYAGLQRLENGSTVAILSFWDVFCEDSYGRTLIHRPRLIYPADDGNNSFTGEGTGAHKLVPYPWEAGHWYRVMLTFGRSSSGNTVVSMGIRKSDEDDWTILCQYDLGVPDVCMKNDVAVFLENFAAATSGEIRTMECRNIRIQDSKYGWKDVETGIFSVNYLNPDYPGSYYYNSDGTSFYIITTGVEGKAWAKLNQLTLRVQNK